MKHSKIARLVIIGLSGSGKGTQAKLLEKKFGWKHISMGELFRKEIERETKIGKKIEELIAQGVWVSTGLTFKVLKPVLKKELKTGFVLDGFPRVPDQPRALDEFLAREGDKVDLVIHLIIRPRAIMARRKRLWAKGKSFYENKRKDETKEAIKGRVKSYEKTIKPILDYYQKKGILEEVDGERSIEEIHRDIAGLIKDRVFKRNE